MARIKNQDPALNYILTGDSGAGASHALLASEDLPVLVLEDPPMVDDIPLLMVLAPVDMDEEPPELVPVQETQ